MNRLGPSTPPDRRAMVTASESDSDLNPVFSARKSLKDVFTRAMRNNDDSPDSKSISLPPDAQVIDDDSQGACKTTTLDPTPANLSPFSLR